VVRAGGYTAPLYLQHAARKGAYRRPRTRLRHPSGVGERGADRGRERLQRDGSLESGPAYRVVLGPGAGLSLISPRRSADT
jgi:predicted Zn-dependent protease